MRAAARQPTAEEVEEGGERADEEGELVLAADEDLGDIVGDEPTGELEVEELVDIEVED